MQATRFITLFTLVHFIIFNAAATEIIDDHTVYSPGINICVSSFGGLIQSQEVIVLPGAAGRIDYAKKLLMKWIEEKNDPGFYLKELDPENFYWQFIETKKYVGVILMVPAARIEPDFFDNLGSGLTVPGKEIYGTSAPWCSNNDMFSLVINKGTKHLEHFENWRFTDSSSSPKWMTKSQQRDLLAGSRI